LSGISELGHSRRDCRVRSLVRYQQYPTLPTESCVLGASSAGSSVAGQGRKPASRSRETRALLDGLTLSLCRQAIMATRLARAHLCWCRRERPGSVWKQFAAESSWVPQGVLKLCNSGALVRTAGCAGISQCLLRHWNLLVPPTPTDGTHLACFILPLSSWPLSRHPSVTWRRHRPFCGLAWLATVAPWLLLTNRGYGVRRPARHLTISMTTRMRQRVLAGDERSALR